MRLNELHPTQQREIVDRIMRAASAEAEIAGNLSEPQRSAFAAALLLMASGEYAGKAFVLTNGRRPLSWELEEAAAPAASMFAQAMDWRSGQP